MTSVSVQLWLRYLWGYHAPHEKAVVLELSPTRSWEILYDFFPSLWRGIVRTDGAAMYPRVFRRRAGIVHIECMAHLRRYVLEVIKSDERQARQLNLNRDQRGLLRHAKAKPVLKPPQRKLRVLEHTAPPSGYLREAVPTPMAVGHPLSRTPRSLWVTCISTRIQSSAASDPER